METLQTMHGMLSGALKSGVSPKGDATGMLSTTRLSELVGSIYDCALNPACWPETMAAVRRELDFCNAAVTRLNVSTGNFRVSLTSGIEADWIDRMPNHRADILHAFGGFEKVKNAQINEPVVLSWENECGFPEGNGLCSKWCKPQGIIDMMAVTLARDETSVGAIWWSRHEEAGAIGKQDVENARLLMPHLQRAVAISRLLDIKSVTIATFEAVLDTLSVPMLLTDANLRLVHANSAGERMLAGGDILRINGQGRVVTTRDMGAASALAASVGQAARGEGAIGGKGLGVPVRGDDGQGRVLHVLPLSFGKFRSRVAPNAAAAIFIAPALDPHPIPCAAIAALFDLTPMEGRVFEHIAAGRTNAETARELGIGVSTVKTHLLGLFAKTGSRRRTDIVGLAASFALPMGSSAF